MKNYSMCFIDFCRLRRLIRLFKFAILVYQSSVSTVFMFMLDSSNMLTVIFWKKSRMTRLILENIDGEK